MEREIGPEEYHTQSLEKTSLEVRFLKQVRAGLQELRTLIVSDASDSELSGPHTLLRQKLDALLQSDDETHREEAQRLAAAMDNILAERHQIRKAKYNTGNLGGAEPSDSHKGAQQSYKDKKFDTTPLEKLPE